MIRRRQHSHAAGRVSISLGDSPRFPETAVHLDPLSHIGALAMVGPEGLLPRLRNWGDIEGLVVKEGKGVNHDMKYILLVDDNEEDVRLFCEAANRKCKADVHRTGSGKEAIELLRKKEIIPSLVVLEIDLPSADGYALLRHIREDAALHTVPVVILTGILSLENLDPAWTMGANALILKPDTAAELKELVQAMCELWLRFSVAPRPLMLAAA